MTAELALGMQGWDHAELIGTWYSPSVRSSAMLREYSKRFRTVEVDDTFYGIPPEPLVREWRDSVPADFTFALKAPQQVTHERRFSMEGGLLKRFLERVSALEGKLGPVLLLAPIGFEPDDTSKSKLRCFVEELPTGFKWALELRHVDWFTDEVRDLLSNKNVAIVCGENRWIRRSVALDAATNPTADFAYFRWNARLNDTARVEHSAGDEHGAMKWSRTLDTMSGLVEVVYGYFNINAYGNGARSVEELRRATGRQSLDASVSGEAAASLDRDGN